jgi:two-component system, chemotaxis family, CheB/CheR fusion protein
MKKKKQIAEQVKTTKKTASGTKEKNAPKKRKSRSKRFPIIALGGSAGALSAFENFFINTPLETGMAFVVIQHLNPEKGSLLPEIISRSTKMQVYLAKNEILVEPNSVYVIPPNKNMVINKDGILKLSKPEEPRLLHLPIDIFLNSLAVNNKELAGCVIFSGMGKDGMMGVKSIKEHHGITLVQRPSTATFDSMPRSAIDTGMVDYILPVEELPVQLFEWCKRGLPLNTKDIPLREGRTSDLIQSIFELLLSQTGHDFSYYKMNTISRRIESRMNANQIHNLSKYVQNLRENPREIEILFKEFLINVTNFFRDPETFEILKNKILPPLIRSKNEDDNIRIWVPGCSTGEEAYSIAIIFRELLEEIGNLKMKVQIFATDIDDESINKARAGVYPASILKYVSEERLEKFFTKKGNNYNVKKEIREMIVFATHSVIKDPPFTKLDLLSCRNLLIYLTSDLQKKLIYIFHYALNTNGVLFLGSSETLGGYGDLFLPLDAKWRIFKKKEGIALSHNLGFPVNISTSKMSKKEPSKFKSEEIKEISSIVQKELLESFAPPSVVINKSGEILYINGETGKFLQLSPGQASLNIFEMAKTGLKFDLSTAVQEVSTLKNIVIRNDLMVKNDNSFVHMNLKVKPFAESKDMGLILVVFEELPFSQAKLNKTKSVNETDLVTISELQKELSYTKKHLQNTIEEMETSLEELTSTNEESQSINEELQSANEELTTSKEEMQSLNEELTTLNVELQHKMMEFLQVNNDMKNLLQNTDTAIIFLDNYLNIKRFSAGAAKVIKLIPSDAGRPISDIVTNLVDVDMVKVINSVLESLNFKQMEVQTKDEEWYTLRISPYRTADNFIEGAVVTFTDITKSKKLDQRLRLSEAFLNNILESMRDALIVLDKDLRIISVNRVFYKDFKVSAEQIIKKSLYDIGKGIWDIPQLKKMLNEVLTDKTEFNDFSVELNIPGVGHKIKKLNARRIVDEAEGHKMILLAIEDDTNSE